jgi:uncharacterized protein (TIGR02284 family)
MMTIDSKAVAILNELIATCQDGANGYHSAAEAVSTGTLKDLFGSHAEQRTRFIAELLPEVRQFDNEMVRTGSVAGSVHRGWMSVKAAVTGHDAYAILAECERGDSQALQVYEAALPERWPPEIRAILEKQYVQLREARQRVHLLRVIGTLNSLIAICKDGEMGYADAAASEGDQVLKEVFETLKKQRAGFAAELAQEYHRLGGDREKMGTWMGKIHRGWMSLEAALKIRDAQQILKECARGERAAMKQYEEALAGEMPAETRTLLDKQCTLIKESYSRIRALQGMRATT